MADNTPYYRAEAELVRKIQTDPHEVLADRIQRFVRRADPDVNRELFRIFSIKEQ